MFRELKIKAFKEDGNEMYGTGGSYYNKTDKQLIAVAKRKLTGMIKRGYFEEAIRFEVFADGNKIADINI